MIGRTINNKHRLLLPQCLFFTVDFPTIAFTHRRKTSTISSSWGAYSISRSQRSLCVYMFGTEIPMKSGHLYKMAFHY